MTQAVCAWALLLFLSVSRAWTSEAGPGALRGAASSGSADVSSDAKAVEESTEEEAELLAEAAWDAESRVVAISNSPRIYQVDDFFSDAECDFLRAHGQPQLQHSLTIDRKTGGTVPDKVRTNMQMYVSKKDSLQHPLIRRIVRRLYRLARMPLGHGEQIQIGRYRVGEKYDCHFDSEVRVGVIRPATVLAYLSDVDEGGETVFPMGHDCQILHQCCDMADNQSNLLRRFHPKKGRAMLFYSHNLDASLNQHAVHCSCPVVQGEKWIMQAWFRGQLYPDSPHYPLDGARTASHQADDASGVETSEL